MRLYCKDNTFLPILQIKKIGRVERHKSKQLQYLFFDISEIFCNFATVKPFIMKQSLLLLMGAFAICSGAYAATPDFSASALSVSRNSHKNSVKVSDAGQMRVNASSEVRHVKSLLPKAASQDDRYNVEVLLKEDFASLGAGNMEDPTAVNITEENGDLKGLPGWSGVNVYDAGQAVYVQINKIMYEDGWFEPEGELWTAPVRDVAGKTLRLRVDVKGVYSEEDMADERTDYMNCIFMAYSDEMPGRRKMIDFPYFHVPYDFETQEVELEIPETISFYNEDDEMVECPISEVRVKLQPSETSFFISSLEIASVSPKVGIPQGLSFCNFSADGYTAVWDAVEDADKYAVQFFTAEFDPEEYGFMLTLHSVLQVTEPRADVVIPTDGPTFFNVTAINGDLLSPTSELLMVYSALPPAMKEAKVEDGKVTVTWDAAEGAAGTEIVAYRQVNVGDAGKDYQFLDIDFSNAPDGDEGYDILWLDDYAFGWAALPYPAFEDGAISINNSGALWGMPDAKLISANTYDFSNVAGKVKMIVTAKTTDYCGMVVAMGGTDPESGETVTLDYDVVSDLTEDFVDYEFELEGSNAETMFLVQADNSLGTLVVRRIQIIADFKDDTEIGYPYFTDYDDVESMEFDAPAEAYDRVKVIGRTIKEINVEDMGYVFTVAQAISAYSDPVFTDISTGVSEAASDLGASEFYTIDGRRLRADRPAAGIYIEKKEGQTFKRIVR